MKHRHLTLCIAIALASAATAASETAEPATDWTERLGAALAIDASRLDQVRTSSERLSDGREIVTVKAIDGLTGEIVGRSFQHGNVVDRDALRHESDIRWRFAHGAMTPALVAELDTLPPPAVLKLDLWYAFQPPEGALASGGRDNFADGSITMGGSPMDPAAIHRLTPQQETALPMTPIATGNSAAAAASGGDKPAGADMDPVELAARKERSIAAIAAAESANQFHIAEVRAAMSRPRQAMLDKLAAAGVTVRYASDIVPSVSVEITRPQLERVARWADVALIDLGLRDTGPSLSVARPSHNITPINNVGYDGSGVTVAVVEGGRVYSANPFLTVSQTRDSSMASADHTTWVAGVIASTHNTQRGMASAATLISADGSYDSDSVMETAIDWAAARAQVMNYSWGRKNDSSTGFNAYDRRLDYIARTLNRLNVHAAGNHGAASCGQTSPTTLYGVESPGRGYNTLTVGGFNAGGTQAWANDTLYNCSAFTNPTGDSASAAHEKPEVVASAVDLISLARTTSSTAPLSDPITGTSFAAPAVAGLAADLMEADSRLATSPVLTRALIMAGATRHVTGSGTITNQDGAGAINGTASTFSTDVGLWAFLNVDASSFPRSYQVYAQAGQRVRYVINWLSNVTLSSGTYSNDRLPADLDLRAYRSDGTTLVATSLSTPNAFEIVDFIAPADDVYEMRVTLFNGSWTGAAVPFAAAANINGYLIPRGTWWNMLSVSGRQGDFFDIRPAFEYSGVTNNWRGVGLRPATTADYDLELYDASWFDAPTSTDTYNRPLLTSSAYGTGQVDFIMIDGNHWPSSKREYYRVKNYSGSGAFMINAADYGRFGQNDNGTYGPFSLDAGNVLWVGDITFDANSERRITLIPGAGADSSDLGLALYRSDPANSSTWARSRSQSVASSDSGGVGAGEQLRYRHDGAFDYLGIAVFNKTVGTLPQFYIKVTPSAIFAHGFDSF